MSQIRLKNQSVPDIPAQGCTEFWMDSVTRTIWSIDEMGLVTQYANSNSSSFAYSYIVANQIITVPIYQQMIVSQEITVLGELNSLGETIIID